MTDVEALDPQKVTRQFDPQVTGLETSLRETLADVFGPNSRSYRNYQPAASLDTAGVNMNGTPLQRVIEGLVHGKERSITLLNGAIRFFEEKMQDDFPGEPLDQVALSGRTIAAANGGAALHVEAGSFRVQRGDAQLSLRNNSFEELQASVALLEASVTQLRRELSRRDIGIGHNQGPDFSPLPIEELSDVDDLIALLKDRGPLPPSDPTPLIQQNAKVAALGERINEGLIGLGKEMARGAAREVGRELIAIHWAAVSGWIKSVGVALLTWLGS
jgi:hypothetical protein